MVTASIKEMTSDFVKLERFDGGNFIRWQKKMHFLLTTLKVAYVLTIPRPPEVEGEAIAETRARQKWDNDDYICTGHILNGMDDALFDVYQNVASAKELWDKLEEKYMAEDATSKKFLVTRFNNYKMVDGRSVMEQLHEIERILNNFKQHNMHMDDTIIVSSIIDKLPPSWKEFKRTMKHRKDDVSLEKLSNHFRLKEEYRKQDDTKEQSAHANLHVMEDEKSNKANKKRYRDFNKSQDIGSWWIDSGATRHVCKNRDSFKTFKEENETILYMRNASTVQVMGKGTVELEFTSGRVLTLTDVYYVPEVRKNLVSVPLLNKYGFKSVFEGDKFILSKGGVFVGKGYLWTGESIDSIAPIFLHMEGDPETYEEAIRSRD
ncbi:hypothetical protein AAHE18_18G143200 [Arachis hypogaea]